MRKKIWILLTACTLIIIIIVSPFIWNLANSKGIINRNFDNQNEEQALITAENTKYSSIASLERFNIRSGKPETYIPKYTEPAWANFIDSKILDYYQAKYKYLQRQMFPPKIEFSYTANVTYLSQMRIYNSPGGNMTYQNEIFPWHNNTVVFYDIDNSALLTSADFMVYFAHVFYKNQSGYHQLQPDFDLYFSNCYLVEMELIYSEYYGPLHSFMSTVRQTVVLDQNFVPIWIGIVAYHGIS